MKRVLENKNLSTSYAGLRIYKRLWEKYGLGEIIDRVQKKHSGSSFSSILQNLLFRLLIDADSLKALSEKDKEEFFLVSNASLDRTTYGRNLNKLNDEQREEILDRLNHNILSKAKLSKEALLVFDPTAIHVHGKCYENISYVWDGCEEKLVRGYQLNNLLLVDGKLRLPIAFNLQDSSKETILEMFKKARIKYGINKIAFDAGSDVRGMPFFKKLDEEGFLFYTKAVSNWYFNYGKDFTATELKKRVQPLLKRNGILSRTVWKDDMKLRLVFVLNDGSVYLTNDFESSSWQVVSYYGRRWSIEETFKEEKQNLGLNVLPTRKFEGIKSHILLVLIGFILSQVIIAKLSFVKGIKTIKRLVVKIWAIVTATAKRLVLRFAHNFSRSWIFSLF